jgi:hypothetical protein
VSPMMIAVEERIEHRQHSVLNTVNTIMDDEDYRHR